MTITLHAPDIRELKPRITVFGVGGAGGNAVNNMIENALQGVDFVVANTDAQALMLSKSERRIQLGLHVTEGLGAGSQPEVGRAAAEEVIDEIVDQLRGVNMVFITAGMGGGTGTGAAPVIARAAREMGILTVGVVTKPFHFEGARRQKLAESGIIDLQKAVDTLIVIPNQNLFRVANERTTFAEAFAMADRVLYSGVSSITDLMVRPFMINLDFADVRAVMQGMGKAMMGTGEATGEKRAIHAAEAAIANPLLDEVSMKGARGLLISVTGGPDMALYEIDEAATRIKEEVDPDANIIFGASEDASLEGVIRVSVVATGIDNGVAAEEQNVLAEKRVAEVAEKLRQQAAQRVAEMQTPRPVTIQPVSEKAETAYSDELPLVASAEPSYANEAVLPAAEINHVSIAPAAPKSQAAIPQQTMFDDAPAPLPVEPDLREFVPSRPEIAQRPVRMPSAADLPLPVQQQMAASRPSHPPAEQRKGLLQRLATLGMTRREDEGYADATPVAPVAAEPPRRAPAPPAASHQAGQLDPQGRAQPRTLDADNLEIPAFLRRQVRN
jgi:cell division protein FtsZ